MQQRSENLIHRISGDCMAYLKLEGLVTKQAVKKLIAFLELEADTYPEQSNNDHPGTDR